MTNEKTPIKPEDIRPGDVIRWERETEPGTYYAVEYVAYGEMQVWKGEEGTHYLLDRPEPPFEPYWGMVIGEPHQNEDGGGIKAVYVPTGDDQNWFSHAEPDGLPGIYYFTDKWAKEKLASGWVEIKEP